MGAPDRRSEPDAAKREPASGQRTRVPSKTGLGSGGRAPSLRVFRGLGQASHCRGPYAAMLPSARRLCLCPGRCPTSESSSLSSTLCAPHETHLLPLVFPSSLFFSQPFYLKQDLQSGDCGRLRAGHPLWWGVSCTVVCGAASLVSTH